MILARLSRLTNTGQHPRKEVVVGSVSKPRQGQKEKGREAARSESITRAKKVLMSVDGLTCFLCPRRSK